MDLGNGFIGLVRLCADLESGCTGPVGLRGCSVRLCRETVYKGVDKVCTEPSKTYRELEDYT